MLVNTLIKEANGTALKAQIYQKEDNQYIVEYYINGAVTRSKSFNTQSITEIENEVNSWLNSVVSLNG
jgi:hypothetical protein